MGTTAESENFKLMEAFRMTLEDDCREVMLQLLENMDSTLKKYANNYALKHYTIRENSSNVDTPQSAHS